VTDVLANVVGAQSELHEAGRPGVGLASPDRLEVGLLPGRR
jgi:hypothetical protein